MKYKIVGIEHAVGDFIPTSGRNANIQQHYDLYRLHSVKASKTCIGGLECVIVRCTPDQMGQIIADCGGKIEDHNFSYPPLLNPLPISLHDNKPVYRLR